ncbi:MAG: phospho-N-acetylmuramoyl-pentapeptide-transferase [Candidatus Delongbacteria bacterium]|nr:phospho-N-acetylmuramoyl-pentapeptide-transferase [Candidatus Delongbacteria bacterium]
MIELIINWMKELGVNLGFFRLYGYITFRAMIALSTSLLFTLFFGFRIITYLYRKRMWDTSGGYLSIDSTTKKGTPTSGGLIILVSTFFSVFWWARWGNPFIITSALAFAYFGLVGFIDDWQKVKYKSSLLGLSQKAKTLLMLLFIVPFALYFVSGFSPIPASIVTPLYLPFFKHPIADLGSVGYAVFVVFVFFSILNSINITDGLDGLLSGSVVMTIGVYGIFAYIIGNKILAGHYLFEHIPNIAELTVMVGAIIGSLLGFLWFNSYPAEVFMGDTGSLSIGAVMAVMVCFTKQEFLFIIAGGVFFIEILTSFIQEKVGNRIGRRIFYRAPIHHSYVHQGIAEPKTVIRFWIISLLLSFIALLSIKIR